MPVGSGKCEAIWYTGKSSRKVANVSKGDTVIDRSLSDGQVEENQKVESVGDTYKE